jgi:glyoxylase-like metal-dependent hydrolase (beta-lactamase superfamily II)
MKRTFVLGAIVLVGAMAAGLSAGQAPAGQAAGQAGRQGGGGRGPGVGMIQKVADRVYYIPGAGGSSTVFDAADGVVLVDTKLANNGQAILDQIRTVTQKPIAFIINTHTHGDHTGSNQFFPANVQIVTHANTEANMKKMEVFQQAANAQGMPDRTFTDRLTLLSGNDAIDLYYFGRAHTDGDAWVVFRNSRVLASGDAFTNTGQPNIDLANGGSGVAYPDTIAKAAQALGSSVDVVIGGHAPAPMKGSDIADYAEFMRLMVAKARSARQQGKTPEQAMMEFQSEIPAKFKTYGLGPGRGGPGGSFVQLFEELGR